jgi:hypothetical protein
MAREVMTRKAADNVYRHMDFHGALSNGIAWIEEQYGAEAVREYVRRFARQFYASVTRDIRAHGLGALRRHLRLLYAREGGRIRIESTSDELLLEVRRNPAVAHMRERGYAVAPLFFETSRTLFEALCEGTPYSLEWLGWGQEPGRCSMRFSRRQS